MFPHAELPVTSWFWPLVLDSGSAHTLEAGGNRVSGPSGRPRSRLPWSHLLLSCRLCRLGLTEPPGQRGPLQSARVKPREGLDRDHVDLQTECRRPRELPSGPLVRCGKH